MGRGEHQVTLCRGVAVEKVGNDYVVKAPGSTDVVMLSGEAALVVGRVEAGQPVAWSDDVAELIRRGVLAEAPGLSRRGFITAGALGAGAGIVVLAMPGVAQAASQQGAGEVAVTFINTQTTQAGPGARHVVRVQVSLPGDFVAPIEDPVAVSAVIGDDQVAAEFVTLVGDDRDDWYTPGGRTPVVRWNISTALGGGNGWGEEVDGEVVFTWGTVTYRATGKVGPALGFGGLG